MAVNRVVKWNASYALGGWAAAAVVLAVGVPAGAQVQNEDAELLADDREGGGRLGFFSDLDGETAIVGAPDRDETGRDSGAAYIFDAGNGWSQSAKLLPDDGASNDGFGRSVGISGDVAIVGASEDDDNGSNSGSAYIFQRINGEWSLVQKLLADDGQGGDEFGRHVAISGDTAIVAAPGQDGAAEDAGAVYVFQLEDGLWMQMQKLVGDGAMSGDGLGWIDIDGDVFAVASGGADRFGGINVGIAYIFERNEGVWAQEAEVFDDNPSQLGGFGNNVSVSGGTILIAANSNDHDGMDNAGAAFVFEKIGGEWTRTEKLISPDPESGQEFGSALGLSGDTAVIGAIGADSLAGAAYVFERVDGNWQSGAKLVGADTNGFDFFGLTASVSGRYAVVGAPFHDHDFNDTGAGYLFDVGGGDDCPADLTGPDGAGDPDGVLDANDFFFYLGLFAAGDAGADLTDAGGSGNPDGIIDANDFFFYLQLFAAGCP